MKDEIYVKCKNNKAYSPKGVRNLIARAEKENGDNLQIIFDDKHKYKHLIEMYHGSFLALALYKQCGSKYKFNICVPENDPPDLFFLQDNGNGAFPVEIMELYKYNGAFKNYGDLASHIWDKKGPVCFEKCYLLLASRLNATNFDVTKFVHEMKKFDWKFQRIYISFYTEKISQWTFFEIFPPTPHSDKNFMSYNLNDDKKYYY